MPILTAQERIGRLLHGRYRLDALLSEGGMGILFRATDEQTERTVAVKMLKPAYSLEPERVARFLRETRIAATLRHPHVAQVVASSCDAEGTPYLVMELLDGVSLDVELRTRGTLSLPELLDIALPISDALSAAHGAGIVHRDVKPANIFLCRSSAGTVPKLLDFGIARCAGDEFETHTGLVVGTPGYMAPEQARLGECGVTADVWSLGAVLYRGLTGRTPHESGSARQLLERLVRDPVPPLQVPGVGKAVRATIDRALSQDPHRRYPSMRAFALALQRAMGSGHEAGVAPAGDSATEPMLPVELTTPENEPRTEAALTASAAPSHRRPGRVAFGAALVVAVLALSARHADPVVPRPAPNVPERPSPPAQLESSQPAVIQVPSPDIAGDTAVTRAPAPSVKHSSPGKRRRAASLVDPSHTVAPAVPVVERAATAESSPPTAPPIVSEW